MTLFPDAAHLMKVEKSLSNTTSVFSGTSQCHQHTYIRYYTNSQPRSSEGLPKYVHVHSCLHQNSRQLWCRHRIGWVHESWTELEHCWCWRVMYKVQSHFHEPATAYKHCQPHHQLTTQEMTHGFVHPNNVDQSSVYPASMTSLQISLLNNSKHNIIT